jgi:integrase
VTTLSRGTIRKRTWTSQGAKKTGFEFTVVVERDGASKRVRRTFPTRAEAVTALDAFKDQTRNPVAPAPPAPSSITLAAAIEKYLQLKARKKSLHEDERIGRVLQEAFGADRPLASVTASVISEYKGQRLAIENDGAPLSPAAINRPLQMLRHLLRLAHEEWEVLPAVPKIRLEKERQGRLRWLTAEEATLLLGACRAQKNADLVDLVELAIFTGMRQGELLGLSWADVDRSRGVVLLEITKGGRRREVPLCGPADAVLARRAAAGKAEGLVFGTSSWYAFRAYWEAAVVAARLDGLHFHDLRHTFASWAMQRGATLPELQALLGHKTLAMTMRYAHLAPEHLRSAVSRLDDALTVPARQDAEETQEITQETTKGLR